MTINTSPASRELTAFGHVSNRAMEARHIRNARIAYLANGGLVGVYATGASYDMPAKAYGMAGIAKVSAPIAAYLAPIAARQAEMRAAIARSHEARLARAAEFSAVNAVLSMVPDDSPMSA